MKNWNYTVQSTNLEMIYAADIGNPNEIKKLILRDVQLYIEEYRPSESNSEEGNEDSLK